MRFTIFRIGWSLVFLSSIIAFHISPRLDDKLTVAFFAIITTCLLRKSEFPERKVALTCPPKTISFKSRVFRLK
jgi:hypothetical protein